MRVIKKYKPDKNGKQPFAIEAENLNGFEYSDAPIPISEITARINELNKGNNRKKLKSTDITEWLLENDYLRIAEINGQKYKLPTPQGKKLGLSTETRVNKEGLWYKIVLYNQAAQEFIVKNAIPKIRVYY